jgi:hypothetical protein
MAQTCYINEIVRSSGEKAKNRQITPFLAFSDQRSRLGQAENDSGFPATSIVASTKSEHQCTHIGTAGLLESGSDNLAEVPLPTTSRAVV